MGLSTHVTSLTRKGLHWQVHGSMDMEILGSQKLRRYWEDCYSDQSQVGFCNNWIPNQYFCSRALGFMTATARGSKHKKGQDCRTRGHGQTRALHVFSHLHPALHLFSIQPLCPSFSIWNLSIKLSIWLPPHFLLSPATNTLWRSDC